MKKDIYTTLGVPIELSQKIKKLADLKGMKIYRLLSDIIDEYIKREKISL